MDPKQKRTIEAVKSAIMVEIKGQQLYAHAKTSTTDPDAKAMFEALSRDEEEHVAILKAQYRSLLEHGKIDLSAVHPIDVDEGASPIIGDAFRAAVKRGTFEMAVIGIGCDLENAAIAFYKGEAAKTEDPDLKKIFTWLSEWEVGHLRQLMEIEKVMQDAYWADQGFSPM